MGVQGLWKLLECSGRPINPESLEGKILAVDISIWLNQAIKGARDRHGNAMQNAHLLTLFHRLCKLLFFRIRPIFVFDGEAPILKKQTLAKRRQKKDTATSEAKKTNDKLLKTFLKRQAIKAALSGTKQSDEDYPSLSHVRKKEEDDIYALPPLEENERNSSEEEEEKEWEERMNHKRLLQDEILANPNSVDIDSEDFSSLPPEVKHEILTDMKEFAKRRRTLYEAMPEDSNDFSQYQLKGLLKKNNLNRCLDDVRKEMNQQCTGEVRAQFETEGGFMKEVETRRLVSEDTSHYILIKGAQSKAEDKKDMPEKAIPSTSNDVPKTYLDKKLASAHKPKKAKDDAPDEAPPSPRTFFAIQEAMMDSNSDEEAYVCGLTQSSSSDISPESLAARDGSLSPRTLQAIREVIAEDEMGLSRKRLVEDNEVQVEQPNADVMVVSSSDEDVEGFVIENELKTPPGRSEANIGGFGSVSGRGESIIRNLVSITNLDRLRQKQNVTKLTNVELTKHEATKRNLFQSEDTRVSRDINNPACLQPFRQGCRSLPWRITPAYRPLAINELGPCNRPLSFDILASSSRFVPDVPVLLPDNRGQEAFLPPQQKACSQEASANVPDVEYVPMTPESIPIIDDVSDRDSVLDSDSNSSFVEVQGDLADGNAELVQAAESLKDAVTGEANDLTETPSTSTTHLQSSLREDEQADVRRAALQQEEEPEDAEAEPNEWQDISMEELESLENNLFVQQSSLQAQRQQQERVAASVTGQMYLESQELLRLFGIPYVVAPMEAEAQCAILDLTDQTSGTITDDSDIWLFGARHVYKNFFSQNKYVEYYQFSDIQNQLGLDRSRLINLAYLMGSDYTEGITSIGHVSAMEILNEFSGHGIEPLIGFKDWWTEAQKNKKIRDNPHDTKVKKKLRNLELHPAFPNPAVADAYLKPVVDDSKGAFAWGRPDLDEIREFCESRFGWHRSKTDDVLLPVMKQLNSQQTQLRIDSFFRMEKHEAQGVKSQRLRRAVTCMKRKEKDSDALEVEEATKLMEKEYAQGDVKSAKLSGSPPKVKRKTEEKLDSPAAENVEGGFLGSGTKPLSPKDEKSFVDDLHRDTHKLKSCTDTCKAEKPSKPSKVDTSVKTETLETSSSSDDEDQIVMVAAKPVFKANNRKLIIRRSKKKKF